MPSKPIYVKAAIEDPANTNGQENVEESKKWLDELIMIELR